MTIEILTVLLSGGICVEIIKCVHDFIMWKRKRAAEKLDSADKTETRMETLEKQFEDILLELESLSDKINGLTQSQQHTLNYIIKRTAITYLERGYILIDEKSRLHSMHDVYHNQLGGNGDLNALMADIDDLPLNPPK